MWDILGIEPTKDIKAIKKAYSKLLKEFHPEEDPEGYQNLRNAFDRAIKYAKGNNQNAELIFKTIEVNNQLNQDNGYDNSNRSDRYDESETDTEYNEDYLDDFETDEDYDDEDQSENLHIEESAEEFMTKVVELYDDYLKRIDLENWESIFAQVMMQLNLLDELNIPLMQYLLDRMLPQEIWKFLNGIFDWESQYTKLSDRYGSHKIDILFSYIYEGQPINFKVDWDIEGFDYDTYIRLRANAYNGLRDNNLPLALENLTKAFELYTDDRILTRYFCEYYKIADDSFRGKVIADRLLIIDPEDSMGYDYRAIFSYRTKEYEQALEDCNKLLELRPSARICSLKVKTLIGLESYVEAKTLLIEALKKYDKDIELFTLNEGIENRMESKGIKYRKEMKKVNEPAGEKNSSVKYTRIIILILIGVFLVTAAIRMAGHRTDTIETTSNIQMQKDLESKYNVIRPTDNDGKVFYFDRGEIEFMDTVLYFDINVLKGMFYRQDEEVPLVFYVFRYSNDI